MLLSLLACLRAVAPVPDTQPPRLEGRVSLELPPGWTVLRNHRAFGNHHLVLESPDQLAQVSVDLVREGARTRELDLMIVSEAYALDRGRGMKIEAELLGHHQLEVAGREAWAVTVQRQRGPNVHLASTVSLRGEQHLALLTLTAPLESSGAVAADWGQILESFVLVGEPVDPNAPPFARDAELENGIDALPEGGW